jgi:hypothetical protein
VRVRFLTYLLAMGVIAGSLVLVGCGGESQQNSQNSQNSKDSHNSHNSQDSQTSQTSQYEGSKGEQKAAPNWKSFRGAVTSVLPDEDSFTVKRNNGTTKTFKYKPDRVRVKQDGKKVGPDAIEKGQLIRLNYVQHKNVNVANSIRIRSTTSGASSGEATG